MQQALDEVFDQALVFHGFTDYLRDYEMITYSVSSATSGIPPAFDRYLFRFCVESTVTTTLPPDTWRGSLDERLLDHAAARDLDGYVWGVRWQCLYPGGKVLEESEKARTWSAAVGIPFHEAVIEANGHRIALVYSDLEVSSVQPGYSPFVATE